MQIIAGGEIKKTTEFISNVSADAQGSADVEAGISTDTNGVTKLFSFLSGVSFKASAKAEANTSYKKDRVIKNILENTLLADFIELVKSDRKRKPGNRRCAGIDIFPNMTVYPEPNSFSFFMLAAPFFTMLNGDIPITGNNGSTFSIDISKIEEAIDKGRGYYEFVAEHNGKEIVLRFNLIAFRNNYTMSDLPKMQLTFYAVHVGKTDKMKLQIEKEFEFGTNQPIRADYSGLSTRPTEVDVYDVLLAGIVEN